MGVMSRGPVVERSCPCSAYMKKTAMVSVGRPSTPIGYRSWQHTISRNPVSHQPHLPALLAIGLSPPAWASTSNDWPCSTNSSNSPFGLALTPPLLPQPPLLPPSPSPQPPSLPLLPACSPPEAASAANTPPAAGHRSTESTAAGPYSNAMSARARTAAALTSRLPSAASRGPSSVTAAVSRAGWEPAATTAYAPMHSTDFALQGCKQGSTQYRKGALSKRCCKSFLI